MSDSESTSRPGTAGATDDWWRWRSFQKPTSSANRATPARTTVVSATEASLRPATATTKLHCARSRNSPHAPAIDALARPVNTPSKETVCPTCHLVHAGECECEWCCNLLTTISKLTTEEGLRASCRRWRNEMTEASPVLCTPCYV